MTWSLVYSTGSVVRPVQRYHGGSEVLSSAVDPKVRSLEFTTRDEEPL